MTKLFVSVRFIESPERALFTLLSTLKAPLIRLMPVEDSLEDIFFKAWYVNVFRRDHEAMFKRMGFHFLVNNKTFGKLYELKCDPFPENALFCRREELRKRYEEHFS